MRLYAAATLDVLGLTGGAPYPRLLDVAAGTGVVAVEAAARADVLATDFAPGMVEVMRRRFAAEGLSARAEVMDGQALSLDDESFDRRHRRFGLIFFPQPLSGLPEICRVLRQGGRTGIASRHITRAGLQQLIGAALDPRTVTRDEVRVAVRQASTTRRTVPTRSRINGNVEEVPSPCVVRS
jgi:ubiquinone/menaquinone biosynthesis C-methylase UbiE